MEKFGVKWAGKKINLLLNYIGIKIAYSNNPKRIQKSKTIRKNNIKNMKKKEIKELSYLPNVPTLIIAGVNKNEALYFSKKYPKAKFIFLDRKGENKKALKHLIELGHIYIEGKISSVNEISNNTTVSYYSEGCNKNFKKNVTVRKLDDLLVNYTYKLPCALKINENEIELIKGAKKTLQNSAYVIVNFPYKKAFKGGYMLQDLINLMGSCGFKATFMIKDSYEIVFLKSKAVN